MLVRELSVVESLFGLELELSALGKFWIQSTLRNDGVVLEAYLNGGSNPRLVGILALMLKRGATIEYVFVDEQFRGQGVGTQLVQAAASLAKEQEMPVIKARAIIQDPFGGIFSRLLEKVGFQAYDTASLLRFSDNPQTRQAWAEFMERRGSRICTKLQERGFRTVSCAEADAALMERFAREVETSFPAHLNPYQFLDSREHRVVRDFSFIALKGDEPAAYSLLTTVDDRTLTFQQLSASFKYQGSGAFLLPIVAFVEKALHSTHPYKLLSTMVYDRNRSMTSLLQGFLQPFAVNINTQYFYFLPLQEEARCACGACGETV